VAVVADVDEVLIERDLAWVLAGAKSRGHGPAVVVRVMRRLLEQWEREALDEIAVRRRP